MRTRPITLTLEHSDIALLAGEGERRGLSQSAMARLIIREWAERNVIALGVLPHPPNAESIPVVFVEKREG